MGSSRSSLLFISTNIFCTIAKRFKFRCITNAVPSISNTYSWFFCHNSDLWKHRRVVEFQVVKKSYFWCWNQLLYGCPLEYIKLLRWLLIPHYHCFKTLCYADFMRKISLILRNYCSHSAVYFLSLLRINLYSSVYDFAENLQYKKSL